MQNNQIKTKRTSVVSPVIPPSHTTSRLRSENKSIMKERLTSKEQICMAKEEKAEEIAFLLLGLLENNSIGEVTGVPMEKIEKMRKSFYHHTI